MPQEIVFCKGGGCTAKLGPDLLSHVLAKLPKSEKDSNLLVGYDSSDDAAVYRISDDTAIVQTLDFFPPMVDDRSFKSARPMPSRCFIPREKAPAFFFPVSVRSTVLNTF